MLHENLRILRMRDAISRLRKFSDCTERMHLLSQLTSNFLERRRKKILWLAGEVGSENTENMSEEHQAYRQFVSMRFQKNIMTQGC